MTSQGLPLLNAQEGEAAAPGANRLCGSLSSGPWEVSQSPRVICLDGPNE